MIYRAYANGEEIKDFHIGGKQTKEIWGGDVLLWKKNEEKRIYEFSYDYTSLNYNTEHRVRIMIPYEESSNQISLIKCGASVRQYNWTSGTYPVFYHSTVSYAVAAKTKVSSPNPSYIYCCEEYFDKVDDESFISQGYTYKRMLIKDENGIYSIGGTFNEATLNSENRLDGKQSDNVMLFDNTDDLKNWIQL